MAFPIIYVDTAGNGGSVTNSGSTDTSTPTVSGTGTAAVSGTTVTLSGGPDLSAIPTDGSATVFINDATNANQKVFRITAVDNGAKTLTVDTAPTGTITASNWAVGGRHLLPSASNLEGALKAGWIVQINTTPAATAGTFLTCRSAGNATDGLIWVRGKTGVRPVLNTTNTSNCITGNSQAGWKISNLELDQDGASGAAIVMYTGWVLENVKVVDAGSEGINQPANAHSIIVNCEVSGCGGRGILGATNIITVIGCYVHDNGSAGMEFNQANPQMAILYNIIESNAGHGIYISTVANSVLQGPTIFGNTIYGNGNSGVEYSDAETFGVLMNNIISENGNAAGEHNVECASSSGDRHGWHGYNVFFHSGGGGASNLSGLTAGSSELTTDPQMTNPAAGDFTIPTGSPAKAAGWPGASLGINGGTGYLDIGALQRQETGGGGGGNTYVVGVIGG